MKKPRKTPVLDITASLHRTDLPCSVCDTIVWDVAGNVKSVVCWKCVAKMADPPPRIEKPTEKRPRGWHFLEEFVSESGQVYRKGKLVEGGSAKKATQQKKVTKKSAKIRRSGDSV